jgi:hypothetical protein
MFAGLAWPAYLSATPHVYDAVRAEEIDDEEPVDGDTPPDEGAVTDEPPTDDVEHSSRASLLQRIAAAKVTRPGLAGSPDRQVRIEAITRSERTGSE